MGVVWAGVVWALATALFTASTIAALGWTDSGEGRSVAMSLFGFGVPAAAAAVTLTMRVMLQRQTRLFADALRLARGEAGPDGPVRRIR